MADAQNQSENHHQLYLLAKFLLHSKLEKNQTHLTAGRMKGKDKSYPDNIHHAYHGLLNSEKHQPSPRISLLL